jgi:hypothetical protein
MRPAYFRIAAAKTGDADAIERLRELQSLAEEFTRAETSFPERIEAVKARRGEAPVRLRKSQREQLTELEHDSRELEERMAQDFAQLASAPEIVGALRYGFADDLSRAEGYLKFYHPDERPLGEELIALKKAMLEKMDDFLAHHPDTDADAF